MEFTGVGLLCIDAKFKRTTGVIGAEVSLPTFGTCPFLRAIAHWPVPSIDTLTSVFTYKSGAIYTGITVFSVYTRRILRTRIPVTFIHVFFAVSSSPFFRADA